MSDMLTALYDRQIAEGLLKPDPAQRKVVVQLEELREAVETREKPVLLRRFFGGKTEDGLKGLYLWGGVGRGKSMLMDMFHRALTVPSRRVHFHAFMQEIHSGMTQARKRGVDDALAPVAGEIAKSVKVLCFDEMQITDITDAMLVGRLFEILFNAGVVIVTTSNRPPVDLYKDGLNRQLFVPFIKLIEEKLEVVELISAQDYRQNRLSGAQVYFSPLNAETRAEIQTLWADLSGGTSEPLLLKVKGREVDIPNYAGGVAKASFTELCGRPLGAADYLTLAQNIRVLILTDIPQLSSERFNEAKRFVTLIDTLYEAGTKLIASAAAAPESLYLEGAGSFEFERTASRLREMQSEEWALKTQSA